MICIFKSKCGAGAALIAAAIIGFGTPAQAQKPSEEQLSAIRSSCRSDFLSNCSGVPRGGKEALDCLRQHMGKLSPACGSAVKAVTPPPAAAAPPPPAAKAIPPSSPPPPAAAAPPPPSPSPAAAAPSPPAPKQLAAPPPPKAVAPKVEKKKAKEPHPTTPPPPAAVAPAQPAYSMAKIEKLRLGERVRIVRACDTDRQAACPGVKAGGSRIIVCLTEHAAALSPICRKAMEPLLIAPAAMAPPAEQRPFTRGAALIAKACARYIALHCSGVAPGSGREVECLVNYVKSGKFVGPRCREVLKLTGHLQ
jgi:hypothetical protein